MATPSSFLACLGTNYAPTDEEVIVLKDLISERERLALRLNARIDELRAELLTVMDIRSQHLQFIEGHRAILSPIRRVPDDILLAIFLASLSDIDAMPRPVRLSREHPSVVASHVCRRWRDLAIGTPRLWSTFNIHIPRIPASNETMLIWRVNIEAYHSMLSAWISRSRDAPLCIGMKDTGPIPPHTNMALLVADGSFRPREEVISTIRGCSKRWKHVRFDFNISRTTLDALRILETTAQDLPLLETVAITARESFLPDLPDREATLARLRRTLTAGLFTAPSLRSLSLHGTWGKIASHTIFKQWAPLTSLEINTWHMNATESPLTDSGHILHILKAFPNLVHASFRVRKQVQEIPVAQELVNVPYLVTLTLDGDFPGNGFASRLTLPSLRELSLLIVHDPQPDDLTGGLVELLTSFGSTLTSLTLSHTALTPPAMLLCFQALSNLSKLQLIGSPALGRSRTTSERDRSALDLLGKKTAASTSGEEWCCPRLQVFEITLYGSGKSVEGALVDLVATRRTGQAVDAGELTPLAEVRARFVNTPETNLITAIQNSGVELDDFHFELHTPRRPSGPGSVNSVVGEPSYSDDSEG
ncbi:hypothetical protein DFP72DRAFT_1168388 [Ephemerocybe angulata]|uniref:F-box domain-containing protein n=1 Tax=Ephemerocybe angulata TaxID=980116 RepID=A0A8H6I1K5_9AGAR|nr:hypothetical protein DFP72DRAFT_1168388 [Tulosesus angulatus]